MLTAYLARKTLEPHLITDDNFALLKEAVWIDVVSPSTDEEKRIEHYIGVDIPTRDDMVEIELSSRLYKENGILFLTATMIAQHDSDNPILDPVSFILTPRQLITVRYIEPRAFKLLALQLQRRDVTTLDALSLFIDLLDAIIDRLADALELVGHRIDGYSKKIFRPDKDHVEKFDYRQLMQQIGASGDLNTKARESLMTFTRLSTFIRNIENSSTDDDKRLKLASLTKDLDSLSDHANFLSTKINFLLDATLGMVGIEQNNIIKIFSVAAVMFLPPTLVASIYGMNFRFIPELNWKYGYLFSIALILTAAWLPYKYFKHRKWL